MKTEDLSNSNTLFLGIRNFLLSLNVFMAVIQVYGIRLEKCMESQIS